MTIDKKRVIDGIEYRYTTNCITVHQCTVFVEDGIIIGKSDHHSCGYMPDQINELKSLFHNSVDKGEINFINSLWTPEVIEDYKQF